MDTLMLRTILIFSINGAIELDAFILNLNISAQCERILTETRNYIPTHISDKG